MDLLQHNESFKLYFSFIQVTRNLLWAISNCMSSGPLTVTLYIFACHYKRDYNLCMLARTDSIQKPLYSI